ncbi:MAG: hypothetical protein KatS3mg014_2506 [Actinomycetota bacterium]|nr:MAG: hypothetical protein KatS3mg014_2499 [Actinomycetota bacterium]GIV00891.1 MAG: hypothetical protein KatS3mg014_2506 [Actinomycetota bacterium]
MLATTAPTTSTNDRPSVAYDVPAVIADIAGRDEQRPVLTMVHLLLGSHGVRAEVTDAYRAIRWDVGVLHDDARECYVPARSLEGAEAVRWGPDGLQVLRRRRRRLVAEPLDALSLDEVGEFPRFDVVLRTALEAATLEVELPDWRTLDVVARAAYHLARAADAAERLLPDRHPLRRAEQLHLNGDGAHHPATGLHLGGRSEVEMTVNVMFLAEMVGALGRHARASSPLKPLTWQGAEGDARWVGALMPVRV